MTIEISDTFLNLTLPLLAIFIAMIALIITFIWKIGGVDTSLTKIETHTSEIPNLSLRIERLLTLQEGHRSVKTKLHGIDITISASERDENSTTVAFVFSENIVDMGLMVGLINKEKWNIEFEKEFGVGNFIELSKREFYLKTQTNDNDILTDYLKKIINWLDTTYIPEAKRWKKDFDEKLGETLK